MNHCAYDSLTRLTSMKKADIRALEAQLTELPHSQKNIFSVCYHSLLNLRRHPSLIARQIWYVAAIVLAHKFKNGVNLQVFNVINAKIPSVVRRLMRLQAPLYLAFTKKINGLIIFIVCSLASLWKSSTESEYRFNHCIYMATSLSNSPNQDTNQECFGDNWGRWNLLSKVF
jgi:hypothetical protein